MVDTPSLIVTTSADIVADDGETSLREAIAFANSNADASTITNQRLYCWKDIE